MPRKRHADHDAHPPLAAALTTPAASDVPPSAHRVVVRLWKEPRSAAGAQPIWRGTICDLRDRPLGSFSSAAELAQIISEMAGRSVLLRVSCEELAREPRTHTGAAKSGVNR